MDGYGSAPLCVDQITRILNEPLPTWTRAAVVATTGEGKVLHWNAGAEQLHGWRRDEAVSRSILELFPTEQSHDKVAEILAYLQAGYSWAGELPVRRRNGLPHTIFTMNFPIGDLAHGRGAIVAVTVGAAQGRYIARHRRRIEAELRRRMYDTKLPCPLGAAGPTWATRHRPAPPVTRAGVYSPIGPINHLAAIHRRQPRPSDPWRLMQRVETYRYRAEGLAVDAMFMRSGRNLLARMWLGLAEDLAARRD